MRWVALIRLQGGVIVVLRNQRNMPVALDQTQVAIHSNALDAGNLRLERLEPFSNAMSVGAALHVISGGQTKQHNVTNHASTIGTASQRTQFSAHSASAHTLKG